MKDDGRDRDFRHTCWDRHEWIYGIDSHCRDGTRLEWDGIRTHRGDVGWLGETSCWSNLNRVDVDEIGWLIGKTYIVTFWQLFWASMCRPDHSMSPDMSSDIFVMRDCVVSNLAMRWFCISTSRSTISYIKISSVRSISILPPSDRRNCRRVLWSRCN